MSKERKRKVIKGEKNENASQDSVRDEVNRQDQTVARLYQRA